MKTFGQLKREIRAQIWPSGEPENLKDSPYPGVLSPHDQHFQEGAAEIAKWVRCEQLGVINVIDFCKTFFQCGTTMAAMPNGNIWAVYTVVGDSFCDPVLYRETSWAEVQALGRFANSFVGTLPSLPTKFPLGVSASDASTDSKCGRSRTGIWCKHNGNIYLAPWIQSAEKIVIEWNGTKTLWEDGDPVNEEQDYKLALQLYCQFAHERDYGSEEKAAFFKMGLPPGSGGYDKALGDLAWSCEQKLKVRETQTRYHFNWKLPLHLTVDDQALPKDPKDTVLIHVGNIAGGDPGARGGVASLAKGLAPNAILNSGNLGVAANSYDEAIGQFWLNFISPYYGVHDTDPTSVPATNSFWPAIGPGDYSLDSTFATWLAFFSTPDNRRYYDVCIWPVHVFVYNTERDPDGFRENSSQAQWLKAKMLLSPAPWKVVLLYHAPYTTDGAQPGMNLPFKSWGASLVLSSNYTYYERLLVGGLTYISNGCGGSPLAGPILPPAAGSQVIKSSFGLGKISASKNHLKYEFLDLSAGVLDSIELKRKDQ